MLQVSKALIACWPPENGVFGHTFGPLASDVFSTIFCLLRISHNPCSSIKCILEPGYSQVYITPFPPAAAPARENRIAARGAAPGTRERPRATLRDPWLPCSDSYRVCQSAHAPLLLDLATQERAQHAIFDARRHFARGARAGRPRPVRASALV